MNGRCFWHGDEPLRPEHTTVCGECQHAFTTAELVLRDLAVRLELLAADVSARVGQLGPSADELTLSVVLNDLEDSVAALGSRRAPEDVDVCPLCSHDL